jgi:hypothetical protein
MRNLKEARQAIAEMEKIAGGTSVFNFRKAQVLYADSDSSMQDLLAALECVRRGIQLKKAEKIFEHNVNFLRMFNLQNHETVFQEFEAALELRVKDKEQELGLIVEKVLERAKQIEQAERDIIARGLVPQEGQEHTLLLFKQDKGFEVKLLKSIGQKYKQAMFFFASSEKEEDKEQVEISQRLLREHRELVRKFRELWAFDFRTQNSKLRKIVDEANSKYLWAH